MYESTIQTQTIIAAPSYPFASVGEPTFCIYGELFTGESQFKKDLSLQNFEMVFLKSRFAIGIRIPTQSFKILAL